MRRNKAFVHKTRKGNVLKTVKEHYLRDDIWCGSALCTECKMTPEQRKLVAHSPLAAGAMAKAGKISADQQSSYVQYLIVDTNVVLHQMDVLQDKSFENIILLQTGNRKSAIQIAHRTVAFVNAQCVLFPLGSSRRDQAS